MASPAMPLCELPLSTMTYVPIANEPMGLPAVPGNPMDSIDYVGWASIIWALGIVVLLCHMYYSYRKMHRLVSSAIPSEDNAYVCDKIASPFVLGIVHPRIYLPVALDEKDREYILAHERYHIQRKDHIVKIVAYLLTCVYWYNILAWLSFVLFQRDMEMSCDEHVVGMGLNIKKEYGALLVRMAEESDSLLSPLSFGENDIKARVMNILAYHKPKPFSTALAIIAVMGCIAVCAGNPVAAQAIEPLWHSDSPDLVENTVEPVSWLIVPSLKYERVKSLIGSDPSVVAVQINGKQGIYDYSGKPIYPAKLEVMDPMHEGITKVYDLDAGEYRFGIMLENNIAGKGYVFSNDFKRVAEANIYANYLGGVGMTNTSGIENVDDITKRRMFMLSSYDEFLPLREGLCPVKYKGKWGYVNERGDPVTEYVFDDASVVYGGRAYVSIDGLYGIIDFNDTFKKAIPVTYDTCTSGWEFGQRLMRIEVVAEVLMVASEPNGKETAIVVKGSRHNVYDMVSDDRGIWYQIGINRWILTFDQLTKIIE